MKTRKPASSSRTLPTQSSKAELSWDDIEPDRSAQPGIEQLSWDDFESMANDFFAEPTSEEPGWADAEVESEAATLAGVSDSQETAPEVAAPSVTEKPDVSNASKSRRCAFDHLA